MCVLVRCSLLRLLKFKDTFILSVYEALQLYIRCTWRPIITLSAFSITCSIFSFHMRQLFKVLFLFLHSTFSLSCSAIKLNIIHNWNIRYCRKGQWCFCWRCTYNIYHVIHEADVLLTSLICELAVSERLDFCRMRWHYFPDSLSFRSPEVHCISLPVNVFMKPLRVWTCAVMDRLCFASVMSSSGHYERKHQRDGEQLGVCKLPCFLHPSSRPASFSLDTNYTLTQTPHRVLRMTCLGRNACDRANKVIQMFFNLFLKKYFTL